VRARATAFIILFLLLPQISGGVGIGVGGGQPVVARAGERVTVEIYCSLANENDENAFFTIGGVCVYDANGSPAPPGWFENFEIDPPLENLTDPSGTVTKEANFFFPNPFKFVVKNSPTPPQNMPPEIENYADCWVLLAPGWVPHKRVRVSFDISPDVYEGEYVVVVSVSSQAVNPGGMVPGTAASEGKVRLIVKGKKPPTPPLPVALTVLVICVVGTCLLLGLKVRKRIRI
jgi:hypothetical protein